jgi:hypothetical protein
MAVQFMHEYDWSMKKILKLMVMSATYQQSVHATPEKIAKDPNNKYLARGPRVRLSSEQIRDQALAVSGLLNRKMYGPSIMPPRPDAEGSNWTDWNAAEGNSQYRRGLYVFWRRTDPYPSMITFDSPVRTVCSSRRIRTNTPLQALILLNDPVYMEAAQALAAKIKATETHSIEEQLIAGYHMVMFRNPSPEKVRDLKRLYEEALHHYQQKALLASSEITESDDPERPAPEVSALRLVANALLNLDEFITKN